MSNGFAAFVINFGQIVFHLAARQRRLLQLGVIQVPCQLFVTRPVCRADFGPCLVEASLIDSELGNGVPISGIELGIVVPNLAKVRIGLIHLRFVFREVGFRGRIDIEDDGDPLVLRDPFHFSGQVERGKRVVVHGIHGLPGSIHAGKGERSLQNRERPKKRSTQQNLST